jgi:hypothetical protein
MRFWFRRRQDINSKQAQKNLSSFSAWYQNDTCLPAPTGENQSVCVRSVYVPLASLCCSLTAFDGKITETDQTSLKCRYCGSPDVRGCGFRYNARGIVKRYLCLDCERNSPYHMLVGRRIILNSDGYSMRSECLLRNWRNYCQNSTTIWNSSETWREVMVRLVRLTLRLKIGNPKLTERTRVVIINVWDIFLLRKAKFEDLISTARCYEPPWRFSRS